MAVVERRPLPRYVADIIKFSGHFGLLSWYVISSTERKKSVTPIKIYKELLTFCAQVTICEIRVPIKVARRHEGCYLTFIIPLWSLLYIQRVPASDIFVKGKYALTLSLYKCIRAASLSFGSHTHHLLWDHWTHCGKFENGVLFMYTIEGVRSIANFITAYVESQ